jgi:hypothetical protein
MAVPHFYSGGTAFLFAYLVTFGQLAPIDLSFTLATYKR